METATWTPERIKALRMISDVIMSAVDAAGSLGCPAGVLYAALMAHGCTLAQFESIMGALVRGGSLRKSGNLYFKN